jgi:pimeloyl-ACP methyl ester carboxylesterase
VFIHGTASSSGRWADLVNDLQSDPVIREHFQFWWFSYSTGNPTPFSALRLRTAIADAVHELDPQGKDPALRQIVLIGHSQGGLLAKMLVIDSGSRLWNALSSKPLDQLRISDQTRDLLRRAAFVTPVPEVRRVIFIATPQHGSFVAGSTIGQLLGRLVTLPANMVTSLGEAVGANPDAVRFSPGSAGFGSVWSMTPDNPALQALAATPISPKVAAHSIIAVQGDGPIETGDDGVVSYKSAHIDGVASELVVRSGHSVQGDPHTVAEVRRILLLHLAQACLEGCVPADAADRPPVAAGPIGEAQPAAANTPRRRRDTLPASYVGAPRSDVQRRLGARHGQPTDNPPTAGAVDWPRCAGHGHRDDRHLVFDRSLVSMRRGRTVAQPFGGSDLAFCLRDRGLPRDAPAMARLIGLSRLIGLYCRFRSVSRVVVDDNADKRSGLGARRCPRGHRDHRR